MNDDSTDRRELSAEQHSGELSTDRLQGETIGHLADGTEVRRTPGRNGWPALYWLADGSAQLKDGVIQHPPNPAWVWGASAAAEADMANALERAAAAAAAVDNAPASWLPGRSPLRPADIFALQAAEHRATAERLRELGRIAEDDERRRMTEHEHEAER